MTILEAALEMAARGYRVFPLTCGGKDPLPGTHGVKDATTNTATIRRWFGGNPGCNYGVAAGNGLLVLDLDKKSGGLEYEAKLEGMGVGGWGDSTFTVRTPGGGLHLYFKGPDVANSVGKIAPGVDIRSEGGYVVGPGSVFVDPGGRKGYKGNYVIEDPSNPLEAPQEIVLRAGERRERNTLTVAVDEPCDIAAATRWLQCSAPVSVEGQGGNDTAYRVATRLRELGCSPETSLEIMLEHWNDRCIPPWDVSDLKTFCQNADLYGQNATGSKGVTAMAEEGGPIDESLILPERGADPVATGCTAPGGVPAKVAPQFGGTDLNTILATDYPPLRWTVPEYVAEGLTILAGRQKLGKTWLALDFAIAVATGGPAMGSIGCEQGDVLYLDYENGSRRLKRRIEQLFPDPDLRPDFSRLVISDQRITIGSEFITALELWCQSVRKPALIVVDVLQSIKPTGHAARNAYENDYSALSTLQQYTTRTGISVVVLHHTRKGGAEDPLEALSGSNGLAACADATLVLDRNADGITLYGRGRDMEEKETALKHDHGRFSILGDASEVYRSEERKRIIDLLTPSDPMSPADIASALGTPATNVRQLLFKMAKAGEIKKRGGRGGGYCLPPLEYTKADHIDNAITPAIV